jgi:hypothetical protein
MFGIFTANVNAQNYNTQWYKTTAFASQTYNYYTSSWNNWTDWQKSNMNIKFDLNNDVIVIYSPQIQIYSVFNVGTPFTDSSGGQQVKFNAYDSEDDRVDIRLRIERNGNSQIYVDYADMRWVYNVVRTQ